MGFYEQSDSESSRGNRSTSTRTGVFNKISSLILRESLEKQAAEAAAQRRASQGNGKYIMNGSNDRVDGMEYNVWQYQTEDDQTSYWYGYTTHGGRRLLGIVEELEKEGKYDEIALIAERDYRHGIIRERLGMVAKNSIYIEAYDKIASKGKSR